MAYAIQFSVVKNAKEIKTNVKSLLGISLLRCKMIGNALFVTCNVEDAEKVEECLLSIGLMNTMCLVTKSTNTSKIGNKSGAICDFPNLYYNK